MTLRFTASVFASLLAAAVASPAIAQDAGALDKQAAEKVFPSKPPYSPYAGRNFPTMPLFGDTHLHTSFSMDAGAFGARLTPRDAYRFARGEEITSTTGQPVKLSRPLDFLVVADHSDGIRVLSAADERRPGAAATPQGRQWYDQIRGGKGAEAAMDIIVSFGEGKMPKGFPVPGTRRLPHRLAGGHQGGRGLQRARAVHGVHRVRVDLEHGRQQPPPQRRLPRERRAGGPGRALHDAAAPRQRQPGRPVEVDGGGGGEDRQRECSPSPTTETCRNGAHVPGGRGVRQEDRQSNTSRRGPSGSGSTRSPR